MTTVVIKDKKVTSKKKTAKKAVKKPTDKPAVKKKTAKKNTVKKETTPKSPQKTSTSAGVGKTDGKQPKAPKTTPKADTAKAAPNSASTGQKKMTQLNAAFKVLQENGTEMNCKAIVEEMMEKGYWNPAKGGLTPQNTLNAGIGTEIRKKGQQDARFKKTSPGKYIVNPDYKAE
ncbi:MAG: winged helix-turn-helix domain-containing protein [Desulfobacterales bacterium]|nr:winged helix-turn-helix domain-containing protein [Desulfobacterales bacterium]